VLLAIARLFSDKLRPLISHELIEATGSITREVVGALTNLAHRHLDVSDASSEGYATAR